MKPLRIDQPQAGYYWRRFVRNGPKIPIKLWRGPPLDPVTGEELERSHCWQAKVGSKHITDETKVLETWISCADKPITEAEYNVMIGKPGDIYTADLTEELPPERDPYKAIDLRAMRPILPPTRR